MNDLSCLQKMSLAFVGFSLLLFCVSVLNLFKCTKSHCRVFKTLNHCELLAVWTISNKSYTQSNNSLTDWLIRWQLANAAVDRFYTNLISTVSNVIYYITSERLRIATWVLCTSTSRWQHDPGESAHRGPESDLLTDMNLTCPPPPVAHTQGGSNHWSLWTGVKGKSLQRAPVVSRRGLSFSDFVSGWLSAAVPHTVDLEETFRDALVRVFGPRQGRQTYSRGAKRPVVTHSSTPPALPTATTKISEPVMQTLRSQHDASIHIHTYVCSLWQTIGDF